MNFEFNEDSELLREQARKMLQAQCPTTLVRQYLPGDQGFDRALWQQMADLGWLGVTIAEEHGGSALGYEGLCVLAEEIGRALAPVPFSSSVYLATPAIQAHASAAQQAKWLPELANGKAVGCWVLGGGLGNPREADVALRFDAGKLNGEAWPVTDGAPWARPWRASWASPWSSRTSRAAPASLPATRWPSPHPMATPGCWAPPAP